MTNGHGGGGSERDDMMFQMEEFSSEGNIASHHKGSSSSEGTIANHSKGKSTSKEETLPAIIKVHVALPHQKGPLPAIVKVSLPQRRKHCQQ